ncbi:MAG: NAD(P)-binding domain-containing protein [Saprospiraceae bacterium]|nr:NAD(P)-binding domain-containing protein [Saprospiraceae bacterium]
MSTFLEEIIIYGAVFLLCAIVVGWYLWAQLKGSKKVGEKIEEAKAAGLHEPVSLHPVIDVNTCIKSGACVAACPEEDILGIMNGRGTVINASRCVGHGACFHACPVEAITLCIGTEKRGVELPHVAQTYETNVNGVYIAGELGGMGLIKNSVEQGRQAVENIAETIEKKGGDTLDLVVVGAGPAGISGSLMAKKKGLSCITLEQDTLGGTVFTFPRSKVVMTSPMELPLYGTVKLFDTSKTELLELWTDVIDKHGIEIKEKSRVERIEDEGEIFEIFTANGESYRTKRVLLAIGRRGTPRKLGVPGEQKEKVAYRLLEPEMISGKDIMVVGGGDSAIESALLLADDNNVTLSYRKDKFSRIKPKNNEKVLNAIQEGTITMKYNTNVTEIMDNAVLLKHNEDDSVESIPNDLIYIFAGGILPTKFLQSIGIEITKKFGDAILKH